MEYSYHNGEKFVISKKLFENDRRGEPESKIIVRLFYELMKMKTIQT